MVKVIKVDPGKMGQRKLSGSGFVSQFYPEDGIVVGGNYIPWSQLDRIRETDGVEFEFDPWNWEEGDDGADQAE